MSGGDLSTGIYSFGHRQPKLALASRKTWRARGSRALNWDMGRKRVWSLVALCLLCQCIMYMDSMLARPDGVELSALPRAAETAPASSVAATDLAPVIDRPPPSHHRHQGSLPASQPPPPPPPAEAAAHHVSTLPAAVPPPQAAAGVSCWSNPTAEANGEAGCEELPSLAALHAAAAQLPAHCELLVATAVFEATRLLPTGGHCGPTGGALRERRKSQMSGGGHRAPLCHVAFVDWQTERALKQHQEAELSREGNVAFVGCWQLLTVGAGMPLQQAAANVLVPQLLLPLLFPKATASLWLDASHAPPRSPDLAALVSRALPTTITSSSSSPSSAAASTAPLPLLAYPESADSAPGGAPDAALILRRHAPAVAARALACAWWHEWLALPRRAAAAAKAGEEGEGGGASSSRTASAKAAEAAAEAAAAEAAAALRALGARGGAVARFALAPSDLDRQKATPSRRRRPPLPSRAAEASWPALPLPSRRRCTAPPPDAAARAALPPLAYALGVAGRGFSGGRTAAGVKWHLASKRRIGPHDFPEGSGRASTPGSPVQGCSAASGGAVQSA